MNALASVTVCFLLPALTNTKTRYDYTEFELVVPSMLRLYIPAHETLDIDIWLRSGTKVLLVLITISDVFKNNPGTLISRRTSRDEEMMYNSLSVQI